MGNLRSAQSYYQGSRRFSLRLTPLGRMVLWAILTIVLLSLYWLGRTIEEDPVAETASSAGFLLAGFNTSTDNEVLDEYFRNAIGSAVWPTTGPDFYTGIHAGTDVVNIGHSENSTYVVFRDHPKVNKVTGEKIPYSCTNGGVRVITGDTERVTVAIKHWHQSRCHSADRIEMIIECPAEDATALRRAIRWDQALTLRY